MTHLDDQQAPLRYGNFLFLNHVDRGINQKSIYKQYSMLVTGYRNN